MARVRQFNIDVQVTNEFLTSDRKMAEALAWTVIHDRAADDLTGPRGGLYAPMPDTLTAIVSGESSDDWMRNQRTYRASIAGRYVRPSRKA